MHIVALNQFYAPHRSATAQLLTELAEGLVQRGHQVTVVASDAGDGAGRVAAETMNGVSVVRVRATALGKKSLATRAADYGSFYVGALAALSQVQHADVFLPLTTPPLVAVAAQVAALRARTPVVALVQDLYPDIAVRLGVVGRGGLVHRAWGLAGAASLRAATRVITLSQPMADEVARYGVGRERIDVIPNWALGEVEAGTTSAGGAEARLEYGLGDRFVVMYSGNLGAGHQFETLLAAARRLRERKDIVFVVVGEGVRKCEVERFVAEHRLDNVKLFPLAPRERLAESLAAADVHLITMRDGLEGLIVPSKLYGILAAERPAIFIGPRRDAIAETLAVSGCGLAFDNGDVTGVVQAVTDLAARPQAAQAMGALGRRHLDERLGRERALVAYEDTLQRATAVSTAARERKRQDSGRNLHEAGRSQAAGRSERRRGE
jgi:glycosyltransferase involved in cell wall biosynthesis